MASTELPLVTGYMASSGQPREIGRDFVFILLMKNDEQVAAQIGEWTSHRLESEMAAFASLFRVL